MLGVLSLIFWSLLIVISLKYVVLILRLRQRRRRRHPVAGRAGATKHHGCQQVRRTGWLLLGVLGTAFFYCDALLTPAISVLGAVEGLSTP